VGALILLLVLLAVGAGGWFFGADSRDGRDWLPQSSPRGNQAGTDVASVTSGGTVEGTLAGCRR
jgi:hypothetical protein